MANKKPTIPAASRQALARRHGWTPGECRIAIECHWCGASGYIRGFTTFRGRLSTWFAADLEVDHVHPVHLGGTHDPENLVFACRRCNRSKGHKHPDEWTA